ncbi:MAG: nucleotidyltransferase family protein [Pirellulaceae bacterium]|nr:nucleotidyltransferase family protein [Pirellulaceae bacterium]
MTRDDSLKLTIHEEPSVFERMFRAVELVKQRLERTCEALKRAGIPYAVIGGNAVAAWVATIDDGAVRNTQDVDILLREEDLDRATEAMAAAGFVRNSVMDITVFLDGPDGKPSQGIHVLLADRKVRDDYASPTPKISQAADIDGKSIIELEALVEMKLNSYRKKDQTHLLDMIHIGLIDSTWPSRFPPPLGQRLQQLLDDPEG